jgi:DNA-directed RNA polymerase specialized sigma24 family protein
VASIIAMDTVTTPQPTNREAVAISVFGPLAIRDGTRSPRERDLAGARPKQVPEILLAAGDRRVPTDRRADLLWREVVASIDVAELAAAIAAAPELYRDTVVAADVVRLFSGQAARQRHTPEATITSRLFRVRRHIARALGEPGSASNPGARDTDRVSVPRRRRRVFL